MGRCFVALTLLILVQVSMQDDPCITYGRTSLDNDKQLLVIDEQVDAEAIIDQTREPEIVNEVNYPLPNGVSAGKDRVIIEGYVSNWPTPLEFFVNFHMTASKAPLHMRVVFQHSWLSNSLLFAVLDNSIQIKEEYKLNQNPAEVGKDFKIIITPRGSYWEININNNGFNFYYANAQLLPQFVKYLHIKAYDKYLNIFNVTLNHYTIGIDDEFLGPIRSCKNSHVKWYENNPTYKTNAPILNTWAVPNSFVIFGHVSVNATNFVINFFTTAGVVALQIRFDWIDPHVWIVGTGGSLVRHETNPLQIGQDFEIEVKADSINYKVSINGNLLYAHLYTLHPSQGHLVPSKVTYVDISAPASFLNVYAILDKRLYSGKEYFVGPFEKCLGVAKPEGGTMLLDSGACFNVHNKKIYEVSANDIGKVSEIRLYNVCQPVLEKPILTEETCRYNYNRYGDGLIELGGTYTCDCDYGWQRSVPASLTRSTCGPGGWTELVTPMEQVNCVQGPCITYGRTSLDNDKQLLVVNEQVNTEVIIDKIRKPQFLFNAKFPLDNHIHAGKDSLIVEGYLSNWPTPIEFQINLHMTGSEVPLHMRVIFQHSWMSNSLLFGVLDNKIQIKVEVKVNENPVVIGKDFKIKITPLATYWQININDNIFNFGYANGLLLPQFVKYVHIYANAAYLNIFNVTLNHYVTHIDEFLGPMPSCPNSPEKWYDNKPTYWTNAPILNTWAVPNSFVIVGHVSVSATNFVINFFTTAGVVAIQIRFDWIDPHVWIVGTAGSLVRHETNPLQIGQDFEIEVKADTYNYTVSINGNLLYGHLYTLHPSQGHLVPSLVTYVSISAPASFLNVYAILDKRFYSGKEYFVGPYEKCLGIVRPEGGTMAEDSGACINVNNHKIYEVAANDVGKVSDIRLYNVCQPILEKPILTEETCQYTDILDDGLINLDGTYTCDCTNGLQRSLPADSTRSTCKPEGWSELPTPTEQISCVEVCEASLNPPNYIDNCAYTNERYDGYIDDQQSYVCQCQAGYASTSGNGDATESLCDSGTWSADTLDDCIPVCEASLSQPNNAENCAYTNERADGLIDDNGSYVCQCIPDYASAGGNGITTQSLCQGGTWSTDILDNCNPVCEASMNPPNNVYNCSYTNERSDGLIDINESYICPCQAGHGSASGDGNTTQSLCAWLSDDQGGTWSADTLDDCIPVCEASLSQPNNVENCAYTNERADGLIDDNGSYVCQCFPDYASAGGDGITTQSLCQGGTWSTDILDNCNPVCEASLNPPNNVYNCSYTNERSDGLIDINESYICPCQAGHGSASGNGNTTQSLCAWLSDDQGGTWSTDTLDDCMPVCETSLSSPNNIINCSYTNERTDGLIDDNEFYVCQCQAGYASANGDGNTTQSLCQSGTWSTDILDDCIAVCEASLNSPNNAHNCIYTKERSDGLIDHNEFYVCECQAGYASANGDGNTTQSLCQSGSWSTDILDDCVPVCLPSLSSPNNVGNCSYTNQRTDGLIDDSEAFICQCQAGYVSLSGVGYTTQSICQSGTWSTDSLDDCIHEYKCGDGTIINENQLCNGQNDCNDEFDEFNCYKGCEN